MAKRKSTILVDTDRLALKLSEAMNKLFLKQEIRTFAQMAKLEEKFEKHTTKLKSDFVEEIDPILKEVTTSREERATDSEQHLRLDNRIGVLEKIHPQGQHLAAVG